MSLQGESEGRDSDEDHLYDLNHRRKASAALRHRSGLAEPYATDATTLYDSQGNYRGRLSTNPYHRDSTANPFGRYGSPTSPDSINNPYGAGNPYSTQPIYVVPQR